MNFRIFQQKKYHKFNKENDKDWIINITLK